MRPSAASAVASTSTMSALRSRASRASARTSARSSHAASPPGTEAGHPGRDGAVADVHVDIEMDAAATAARDLERLRGDVRGAAATDVVERDDGDAPVGRAPRVGDGVREVGDAELHDPPRVEAVLDEAAHRGPVGDAVAQVEVRVDRDEPRRRRALRDRVRRGVVAAQRDHELARAPRARARRARTAASPSGPSGSGTSPASTMRSASPRSSGGGPSSVGL